MDEGFNMDYNVQEDNYVILVENEKKRVKNQILESYISLRKKRGITQHEMAERTGMKRTNIVRIESGKYVPTIEVLVKLAVALDMELEVRLVKKESGNER